LSLFFRFTLTTLENSGMSYQEVCDFAFKEFYVPFMQSLEEQIGREKFMEILKRAGDENGAQRGRIAAKNLPKNDLAAYAASIKNNEYFIHILTYEIVEETDEAFEMRITECLWAKTFLEANATDIGYATLCHTDYAYIPAYNPKIKFIRIKL